MQRQNESEPKYLILFWLADLLFSPKAMMQHFKNEKGRKDIK